MPHYTHKHITALKLDPLAFDTHKINKQVYTLTSQNLEPIWLPHCPACKCTISLIFGLFVVCKERLCKLPMSVHPK